jgi:ElaB/YqjD/DUF883 family membrane-anchored ribosome-binding protein
MGKKLRKREKLDRILSELSELRDDIKKLLKHDAEGAKVLSRSVRARRPKAVPKRPGTTAKLAGDATPSKPVLLQTPKSGQTTDRLVSS